MKLWQKLLLAILGAIVLFFAIVLLFTWPVYHSFTKEVDSYDALCKPFRDSKTVFLPEEDEIPVRNYILEMDGRSLFAKPVSYHIGKAEIRGDHSIDYDLDCTTKGNRYPSYDATREHRGVPYGVIVSEQPMDSGTRHGVFLSFKLEDMFYHFSATYESDAQSDPDTLDRLRARLETYAKQVIDKYSAAQSSNA